MLSPLSQCSDFRYFSDCYRYFSWHKASFHHEIRTVVLHHFPTSDAFIVTCSVVRSFPIRFIRVMTWAYILHEYLLVQIPNFKPVCHTWNDKHIQRVANEIATLIVLCFEVFKYNPLKDHEYENQRRFCRNIKSRLKFTCSFVKH